TTSAMRTAPRTGAGTFASASVPAWPRPGFIRYQPENSDRGTRNPTMATQIVAVRESVGQPLRPMDYQGARVKEDRKVNATMATQTVKRSKQSQTVEDKIQQLRQLYADAPPFAKTALENTLRDLTSAASQPRSRMESAGRTGSRQGKVSELTVIAP